MKTVKFYLIAAAVLLFCSCTNRNYLKAIPENAAMVASINMRTLSEKSDFANSSLKYKLEDNISNDIFDRFEPYMDDPMETGIDLSQPIYTFFTRNNIYGIVMKVNDKDDLEEFFSDLRREDIVSRPIEKNGMMVGDCGAMRYAFNSDALLLVINIEGEEISNNALGKMLKGEHKSFVDTKACGKVTDVDGRDATLYISFNNLPDKYKEQYEEAEVQTNSPIRVDDLEFLASLNFEQGAAVLTATCWGRTEKTQKLLDQYNENIHTIDGTYLDNLPDNLLAWAGMNIDGTKIVEQLKKNPNMQNILDAMHEELNLNIEKLICSLNGDIVAGCTSSFIDNDDIDIPEIYVRANVNAASLKPVMAQYANNVANKAKVEDVEAMETWEYYGYDYYYDSYEEYAKYILRVENVGTDEYLYTQNDMSIKTGLKGNDFYLSTPPNAIKQFDGSAVLSDYAKEIKSSTFFFFLDLHKLLRIENSELIREAEKIGVNLRYVNSTIMKINKDEFVIRIEMEDDSENFLKQIIQ